jgi:hypothetical protein
MIRAGHQAGGVHQLAPGLPGRGAAQVLHDDVLPDFTRRVKNKISGKQKANRSA